MTDSTAPSEELKKILSIQNLDMVHNHLAKTHGKEIIQYFVSLFRKKPYLNPSERRHIINVLRHECRASKSTYLLMPDADGVTNGSLLLIKKMMCKAKHIGFKGPELPAGWRHESHAEHADWPEARYWIEDGALWSSVKGAGPSILWFDTPLAGNHAIRIVSAAMPVDTKHPVKDKRVLAELGAMWNGTGRVAGDDWSLTLFGFNGWYTGCTGIEHAGGKNATLKGHSLTRQRLIEPMRNYEIFAGRCDQTDFVFIDGETAVENLLPPTVTRVEKSYAAITTYGNAYEECKARIESVEVFEIPNEAVVKVPLAPPENRGSS